MGAGFVIAAMVVALGCAPAVPVARGGEGAAETEAEGAAEAETEAVAEAETVAETEAEAEAETVEAYVARLLAMDGSESTSIGGPNDGRVEGAVALPASATGLRSNPRRPNATALYGTVELMQALLHAAHVVHDELPGGELTVNDVGLREGGAIAHHGSHRAGRDVDVLFYLIDREGAPMPSVGAFLDPRGRGYDFRDLADARDDVLVRMDLPRTWRFVRALLEGPYADQVQRIFVVEHLRTLLLTHAERARAPEAVRARFAELTCQPGYPHDDHFHVRFFCTPEDIAAGCEDTGPTYAWRRTQLRALGLAPVHHRPRRDRPSAETTSAEEARAAAGPMHSRVEEWLARREAWSPTPHPGRPFCR